MHHRLQRAMMPNIEGFLGLFISHFFLETHRHLRYFNIRPITFRPADGLLSCRGEFHPEDALLRAEFREIAPLTYVFR
jgi:hypothetical protein